MGNKLEKRGNIENKLGKGGRTEKQTREGRIG
jgi:hypothetical protein